MRLLFNSANGELKLNNINCGTILGKSEYADKWVLETVGYDNSIFPVLNENEIKYEIKERIEKGFYFCDTYIKFKEPREYPPVLILFLEKSKITAKTTLVSCD